LTARFNDSLFDSSTQVLHGFTAKEALDATHVPCSVSTLYLRVKQERERIVDAAKLDDTTLQDREITVSGSRTYATSPLTEVLTLTPPPPKKKRHRESSKGPNGFI
jgi:hypothetical protein